MAAADYSSYYGTVADYFSNNSSGSKSQGKSGGAGGSAQQYQGQGSTGDAVQGGNASSGAAWISAAASVTSSDKSQFTTPFSQQFGGISNNQVINSPGATGATTVSPIAPITGTQGSGASGDSSGSSGPGNPLVLIAIIFAGVALVLHAR